MQVCCLDMKYFDKSTYKNTVDEKTLQKLSLEEIDMILYDTNDYEQYLHDELWKKGKLRQGCGLAGLDLRLFEIDKNRWIENYIIGAKRDWGIEIKDDYFSIANEQYNKMKTMLEIKKGDLIFIPNYSYTNSNDENEFFICEVEEEYSFEVNYKYRDFGHFIKVKNFVVCEYNQYNLKKEDFEEYTQPVEQIKANHKLYKTKRFKEFVQKSIVNETSKLEKTHCEDSKLYYKYLSLEKFERIEKMIQDNKLYASKLSDLNDYWEGFFIKPSDESYMPATDIFRSDEHRVCCMTTSSENLLMWAHYADSFKGIVVAVEIDKSKYKVHNMDYNGFRNIKEIESFSENDILDILTQKQPQWTYEDEKRVIVKDEFVDVKIVEIYFGCKTDDENKEKLEKVIKQFNPSVKTIEHKPNIKFKMTF